MVEALSRDTAPLKQPGSFLVAEPGNEVIGRGSDDLREVSGREASGAALRIKAARFPAHKTLEVFNFEDQPSAHRNLIAHLGPNAFVCQRSSKSRPVTLVEK